MWLAAEVLPVVSILTLGLVVLNCEVGAPLSFEVVHTEVIVLWILVDEAGFQVLLFMGE